MTSFDTTEEDIFLLTKKLDPAHGCDNVSIKMIKICSDSLSVSLKIIFEHSLNKGRFPEIWKKQMPIQYTKSKIKIF